MSDIQPTDAPRPIGLGPLRPAARRPARPRVSPPTIARDRRPVHRAPGHRPARPPRARPPDPPGRHRRPAERDLPRLAVHGPGRRRCRAPAPGELDGRLPQQLGDRGRGGTARRDDRHRGLEPGRSLDRPPGPAREPPSCTERLAEFSRRDRPRRAADAQGRDPDVRIEGVHRRHQHQEGTIDEHRRIRQRERPGRQRLGARPSQRPERPLRRGRRRHDGLRAEPPAGRGRLELDEPAGRRDPPRHRRPRGLQQAPVRVGDRPGHDGRPVRRQQQLVRRVGVLAAQAVRPPGRPHPQRRAQVLARQRAGPERRRSVRTRRPATSSPSPTSACAPSATTSCRGSATRSWRSSTSARRPSSTARSSRPRA